MTFEEVPYAYTIMFEGEVVVPVDNEEQAVFEVNKAIRKALEPFEVWDGDKDYLNPNYSVWHNGFVCSKLVEVQNDYCSCTERRKE